MLHRKLKIEHHEPLTKHQGMNACAPEGSAVSAPLVTSNYIKYVHPYI